MLEFVKRRCIVKGIVSLPRRTFYATPKKTYVLVVERKIEADVDQNDPVFTFLVSEIGETRDANRWTIQQNDLIEAVGLFNQFKGSPRTFVSSSGRCKVVEWQEFVEFEHWMLDRFCWSDLELQQVGVQDEPIEPYTIEQFNELLQNVRDTSEDLQVSDSRIGTSTEVFLGDAAVFDLRIGQRVLKKDCLTEGIPCISANVNDIFGYIAETTLLRDFNVPSLTWSIDGNFDWFLIRPGFPFHPTDHCGVLRILHDDIDAEYLFHTLKATKDQPGFDRTYRANLGNVARVGVEVPTRDDGSFDVARQREIASVYRRIEEQRRRAMSCLKEIANVQVAVI